MSELPATSVASAFNQLHPALQRKLWDLRWESLHPLQVEGINAILNSPDHIILAAPTAAGKTEAAFLPILSLIADKPASSLQALYVGPLKALINDQFQRLNDLCSHLDIPVHHWHGDVPQNQKKRLLAKPSGILLITPESIESLFINHAALLPQLVAQLSFIVIDELHTFLESERGLHLKSLLYRLRGHAQTPETVRCVGLSATIGSMKVAQQFLSKTNPDQVRIIEPQSDAQKELRLKLHGYWEDELEAPDETQDELTDSFRLLANDLVRHCRGKSNLVFSNSRTSVEELADECKRIGEQQNLPDRFLVHHGSLSAEIRRDTEETMKAGTIATTFCSSTLELGVDIGSVRMVGQIDAPWSVSGLKQRLGRSGRRKGEPQILRLYVSSLRADSQANLLDRLHLDLIQAVSMTELLLAGWVEPPISPVCDLSTLTHQIMSLIGETGGLNAKSIYQRLCMAGPFGDIEPKLFAQLLKQINQAKIIEQMPEGDLILGTRGEGILRHFSFYAAFNTPETYAVVHNGENLGNLDVVPVMGQNLLFAARRWLVTDIDRDRKVIMVEPARGRKKTTFSGKGGLLHPQIVAKMQEVLTPSTIPSYLDPVAGEMLAEARTTARESGICAKPWVWLGPRKVLLTTWAGTRINSTIVAMCRMLGIGAEDELIGVVLEVLPNKLSETLTHLCSSPFDAIVLAQTTLQLWPEAKFDAFLGEDLRSISHSRRYIDILHAQQVLTKLK